ncbi:tape measure protein [uncultured Parabacteroides sp.]|uniref:tape measure protein n=1 Tax=uncultured Parabacteroides sp. TaxID=512312 RepID=UPI002803F6E5|nr:tape measure protein [uncultured Parabacteroides sp.]
MAGLYFKVGADYDNVIRLRTEIEKLKSTLSGMDSNTPPATLRAMEVQLAKNTKELDSLVTSAVRAGNEINQNFKKQIFDASQVVNGLSEKIITQKSVIRGIEADVKRLGEAYRIALKKNPLSANEKLEEYNAVRRVLDEEKAALFGLTQQQSEARLSVKKLRDEYALYNNDAKNVVESNNGIAISWKKALAVIGGVTTLKVFGSELVRVRGEFQSMQTTIETLVGKDMAGKLIPQIKELATISPLTMSDMVGAEKMMLGFNIQAEDTIKYLKAISDISMGESGKFNSLTLAFSQMSAAGKLMGQDLNQMINAGFNPLQFIAEKTGKSIATLKDEMSKGAISAEMVQQAFIDATSAGGKFFNMSENTSKTINGQLSMMRDAMDNAFNEMGQKSEGVIMKGIQATTSLIQNYEIVGKVLVGLIATYGAYRTAVMLATAAESNHTIVEIGLTNARILARKAQIALNAAMLTNPYVALAVVVGGLVTTMWALSDSTTAAEKAQEKFNDEQNKMIQQETERKNQIESLIRVIQDDTETELAKISAYEQLQKLSPAITGAYKLEELAVLDLVEANKLLNKERDTNTYDSYIRNIDESTQRLKKLREENGRLIGVSPSTGIPLTVNNDKAIAEEVAYLKRQQKALEDFKRKLTESKINTTKEEIKNKVYWEKRKKDAETARDALDVSKKNSEDWNKYTREIQQAQKEISKYDTTGKAENEINKRLKLQQELSRSILDSELKLQSTRIAAMEDGKAKRIALAEQETKDAIAAIQKEKEEYQKKVKESKGKEDPTVITSFDNRELAAKEKERADIARIEKEYADEYKQRTKALTDVFLNEEQRKLSSIKDRYDKERKWANEQLKTGGMTAEQHKSYTTNIDKAQQQETYRSLLDNLNDYKQKEKDLRNKWDTDIAAAVESKDAYLVAKLMEGKQKALSALNGQMLQESEEWQQLFGNLDNLTVAGLEKLSNTIKEKAKGVKLNPVDAQAVTNSLKEVDEKIRVMNPFGLISKHLKEYKKAEDDVTKKNALKEMFRDAAASIDMVKGSFDAVVGGLTDMGLAGDEATQQLLGDISNLMGAASQLATSIASANPVGIIQGSIGVLTSVFNIFNNDKRHEKKIERLQDQIDVLDKSYEKLGDEIEKVFSKDASKLIDQQNKLLEQQKVLIQQQIREEQDKKKTDKDRIKEWQDQIDEINDVIADNKEKAVDAIFGEDLKSAIENFASDYAEAWASGEDKAESAKDTVKKMMRQMVTESIKAAMESSGAMEKIRKKLEEFYADNVLSGWEQDYIYNMAEELQKEIDRQFGWADSLMKDKVEEPEREEDISENTLKGAYAKASQESIDLLAGQTGVVRILLEDIRGSMQPIREQMKLIYDMQSRGWEDVKAIRELSDKVEKNTDRIAENTREIKEVAGKISENTRGTVDALEGTINVKVKM